MHCVAQKIKMSRKGYLVLSEGCGQNTDWNLRFHQSIWDSNLVLKKHEEKPESLPPGPVGLQHLKFQNLMFYALCLLWRGAKYATVGRTKHRQAIKIVTWKLATFCKTKPNLRGTHTCTLAMIELSPSKFGFMSMKVLLRFFQLESII